MEELARRIQEIEKALDQLVSIGGRRGSFIDPNSIKDLETAESTLRAINASIADFSDNLSTSFSTLTSIVNELTKGRDAINKTNAGARRLRDINATLLDRRERLFNVSSKELQKLEQQNESAFAILKRQKEFFNLKLKELGTTQKQTKEYKEIEDALGNINFLLDPTLGLQKDFTNQIKLAKDEQKELENALGITGSTLKGLSKIPILGDILKNSGIGDANEIAKELLQTKIDIIKASKEENSLGKKLLDQEIELEKLRTTATQDPENLQKRIDNLSKGYNLQRKKLDTAIKTASQNRENHKRARKELKQLKEQGAPEEIIEAKRNEGHEYSGSIPLLGNKIQIARESLRTTNQRLRQAYKDLENYNNSLEIISAAEKERSKTNKEIIEEAKKQIGPFSVIKEILEDTDKRADFFETTLASIDAILFTGLVKGFFSLNNGIIQLQKNLALSRTEALGLRTEFTLFSAVQNDVIINTRDLLRVQGQFNEALGLQGKISVENAGAQLRLVDGLGISIESVNQLRLASEALGTNLREQTLQQYEIVNAVSQQFGVQLDNRQILEEVGKAGAYALVQFKGSVEALTEGAAMAKALGLELSEVNQIAGQLIQFEDSIRSELEAELLLGRQINLERARLAAVNNDQKTLMQELNREIGTFSDFSQLNRIQQEAFASSLGLSVDKLSDMLLLDQYREKSQRQITAEAGKEIANRVETLKTQEQFNKLILKVQQTIVDLVSGPLAGFGKILEFAAENAGLVALAVGVIGGVRLIAATAAIAANLAQAAFFANITVSALSGGLAVAGIIASIAAVTYALSEAGDTIAKDVGDVAIKATGETMISTKEGDIFKPSERDQIAVGPNVVDSLMSPASPIINVTSPKQEQMVMESNNALLAEIKAMRSDYKRLMNRPVHAEIGINKFEKIKKTMTSYVG